MSKKRRAVSEINVVPYIDVMLVLLIIFMITAPIVQQGVEVELPKLSANSLPPEQQEPVILTVSKS
ncbi:MAG: biopolymer transporter ExbD, partial [Gammaproteobacteria bacterium]